MVAPLSSNGAPLSCNDGAKRCNDAVLKLTGLSARFTDKLSDRRSLYVSATGAAGRGRWETNPAHQFTEPRIRTEIVKRRIHLQTDQLHVTFEVSLIQHLERLICFTQRSINTSEGIWRRRLLGDLGKQR